jgi:hypothetical protein
MSVDSICIHRVERRVTPETVLRTPTQQVVETWEGERLTRPYRWTLVLDPITLWFGVEFPKEKNSSARFSDGEFVEWLAQQGDVAELFLMNQSGQYQEFHLTGDGAWWAMTFSGYRERVTQSSKPNRVTCFIDRAEGSWRGVLGIERPDITVSLDEAVLAQVSACLHEDGSVRYVTSAGCPPYEPDFHDKRSFQSVRFSSLFVSGRSEGF